MKGSRPPLKVFYTVDTEFHPLDGNYRQEDLELLFSRDIVGKTPVGEYGAFFQAKTLRERGLNGVFLVEALSGRMTGREHLRKTVEGILNEGHEVGLHLHPEWLRRVPDTSFLGGKMGSPMHAFPEEEQTELIRTGVEELKACGVDRVASFRAGSYGANSSTLRALARNGVPIDTSHNFTWRSISRVAEEPMNGPARMESIVEFPVSFFEDLPGHKRHAQLCACSYEELTTALSAAWNKGWYSFVIVSHSFELVRREQELASSWQLDEVVLDRFLRLCDFLASDKDRFETALFNRESDPPMRTYEPIKLPITATIGRMAQQLKRRVIG